MVYQVDKKIGLDQLVKHIARDSSMSEDAVEGAVRSIVKQIYRRRLLYAPSQAIRDEIECTQLEQV